MDAEKYSYPQLLSLYAGRPGAWREIPLPDRSAISAGPNSYISGVVPVTPERSFILGSDGLILDGNLERGFRDVSSTVDHEYHIDAGAWYQDALVVFTGDMRLRFDGHMLSAFKPKVKVNQPPYFPQTAGMHVAGHKLFLFDYAMRYRIFDGREWATIDVPKALQSRPFRGFVAVE